MHQRYELVSSWLHSFVKQAPGEAARPGVACLDVAVDRLCLSEVAKALDKKLRVSIFLDLTRFYETVGHRALADIALEVGYRPLLLDVGLQVYSGARVIESELRVSPPLYAQRGILAGCPQAPALAKVALYPNCRKAHDSQFAECMDLWLDDLSADASGKDAAQVVARTIRIFRMLEASIAESGLILSYRKSSFLRGDAQTESQFKKLKSTDPQVLSLLA